MKSLTYGILTILLVANTMTAGAQADAAITVNKASQCISGNRFIFTDGSVAATSKYTWDFGDGTRSSAPVASKTYTRPGNYTVKLTVKTAEGSTSREVAVAVNDLPPAGFTVNSDLQELTDNAFEFLASAPEDGLTTTWQFGDGTTTTGTDAVKNYDHSGIFRVTQTVSDAHGCSGKATITVTVKYKPEGNQQMLSLRHR